MNKKKTKLVVFAVFAAILVVSLSISLQDKKGNQNVPEASQLFNSGLSETFVTDISELISEYGVGDGDGEFACCRLIVLCKDEINANEYGAVELLQCSESLFVMQFETPEATEDAFQRLNKDKRVVFVEADKLESAYAGLSGTSTEPISWGTSTIGADKFAESLSRVEHQSVVVAIVDSGVSSHEMFSDRLLPGFDVIENDVDPSDERGHGTHVAGIVADATQRLPVSILPVRVLNNEGKGPISAGVAGIYYAVENGADIINLSLGGVHSYFKEEAISYALQKGVIVVVSAGNSGSDLSSFCPAHIDSCITVSAIDGTYTLAPFSNFGTSVDFCAPGVSIYSSIPGGYEYKDGTSMAAPYISALAAMLKSAQIANSQTEVLNTLISCSFDLGDSSWDERFGHGLPQIDKLIDSLDLPVEEPVDSNALFDNTYWDLSFGQTMGSSYQAKFDRDGTFLAVSRGSGTFAAGKYEYKDGCLILSEFEMGNNVPFISDENGNGFTSADKHPSQVGLIYYDITPSDGRYFDECYDSNYSEQEREQSAKDTVLAACADLLEISEHVLDRDLSDAEALYGDVTMFNDGMIITYTFEKTSHPFQVNFLPGVDSDGDGSDEIIYMVKMYIRDMGLNNSQTKKLHEACALVYSSEKAIRIMMETNNEGVRRMHELCLNGFEDGLISEDAYFLIR